MLLYAYPLISASFCCTFSRQMREKLLTNKELIAEIRAAIKRAGSQKAFIEQLGNPFSEQYLSDVLNGRRDPGQAILDAIGYTKEVRYRKGN